MASQLKLERLLKKQASLSHRRQRQEERLQQLRKNAALEQKQLAKRIQDEQYAVLVQNIRKTGFPVENLALLIGMALKAKEIIYSTNEAEKAALINDYTRRYTEFADAEQSAELAQEDEPADASSAAVSYV